MIHVRDLTKVYKDLSEEQFIALNGISFDAMPGQVFGLLGPNGAGKTTALRILSTVLKPTAGEARINGVDVIETPDLVRRQIGFVSVNTSIYDRMTAWEMVSLFGQLHGMTDEYLQHRMDVLFTRFKMNNIRSVLGSKMSTGMRQKVSIVRALVHDPPVLIFDEATSGLDLLVAREVFSTIEELKDEGKCVIYSSHIMSEVVRLCDRVAIMHRGNIISQGTLRELADQYEIDDFEELFYQLIAANEENWDSLAEV
ncbi:MAG: ATP-binding cassette domain-containing protein [Pirellulaceae bacterium]